MQSSRKRIADLPRPASSDWNDKKRKGTLHSPWLARLVACLRPRRVQMRDLLLLLALTATFLFLLVLEPVRSPIYRALDRVRGIPPNYYEWHEREKALPQNNPDLPPPQGRQGRYIHYQNHITHVGWGNAMQEMVVNHHLAYRSNRIFTMYNYTWDKYAKSDYSSFEGKKIPARIPISALVAGPMAGGEYPVGDYRPPAVTTEFFEEVCPHPTVLSVDAIRSEYSIGWDSAATMFEKYTTALNKVEDNCVELQDETGQIFDFWIFGSGSRMADAWPQLLESPVLTEWAWSPLVTSIITKNGALIHPDIRLLDMRRGVDLKGLLAVHLRRGDFKGHCQNLADWRSEYNAFNVRPDFMDQFVIPPGGGEGKHTDETLSWYMDHCFPEIPRIVKRVLEIRADAAMQGRTLDRMYIATNGDRAWTKELTAALNRTAVWKGIATSRDLVLDREQEFVKQAADMFVATRAEVFVGNGWSSLSSNVNLLRMAQKHNPGTSRFW
ncbi:hypothetical protein PENSPDRAFT_622757 [Peniophora sp. CONT]|nr:hypothetical protein PENSPDRAFT_622757 [Peniophora sp. CONT]